MTLSTVFLRTNHLVSNVLEDLCTEVFKTLGQLYLGFTSLIGQTSKQSTGAVPSGPQTRLS